MHLLSSIVSVAWVLSVLGGIKNKYLTYARKGVSEIINMIFHNHKSMLINLPPPPLSSHVVCFISWKCARPVFWILFSESWLLCL